MPQLDALMHTVSENNVCNPPVPYDFTPKPKYLDSPSDEQK